MKHTALSIITISTLLAFSAFSQDTIQQGIVAKQFLQAHNEQDFKTMKTLAGKDMRKFGGIILRFYSKSNYDDFGELVFDSVEFNFQDSPAQLLISSFSKQDTTPLYISLFLTQEHKIDGIGFYEHAVFYPTVDSATTIDDIAHAYIDYEDNTGLCIGIYDRGEKQSYYYGEIKRGSGQKPNDLTRFQMGSISKVFTALMLSDMMVNHGIDPLSYVSDYLSDSMPMLGYKKKPLTLLHLATHTSGYLHNPTNIDETSTDSWDNFANYDVNHLMAYLKDYELERKPGKQWNYSNGAFGLLGYIATQFYQKPYKEVLKEKITTPLNMPNTTTIEPTTNVFQPYYNGFETNNLHFKEALIGAGGIYTTTEDMIRFMEANLHPQNTPLKKVLLAAQKTWVRPRNIDFDMGLGWWIIDHPFDKKSQLIGHGGHTVGTNTSLFIDPNRDLGIFVAANSDIDVQEVALLIMEIIINQQNPNVK